MKRVKVQRNERRMTHAANATATQAWNDNYTSSYLVVLSPDECPKWRGTFNDVIADHKDDVRIHNGHSWSWSLWVDGERVLGYVRWDMFGEEGGDVLLEDSGSDVFFMLSGKSVIFLVEGNEDAKTLAAKPLQQE